jgi:hypothetical protein
MIPASPLVLSPAPKHVMILAAGDVEILAVLHASIIAAWIP